MLLALLFAMIFGSGGESEFVSAVPNLKKEVKINIEDKARRDSILVLVDGYEGAIKDHEKEKERLQKQVNKVSADRSVKAREFLEYYDAYYESRVDLISSLIDYRLMMQQQSTDKELMMVIEKAIVSSAEQRRENQILEEQTEDNLNEAFREIADILTRNLGDRDRVEKVAESFLEFERTMYDNVDNYRDTNADRKASLLINNPTREELEGLYVQSNQIRYKAARDFAILREAVIVNTTEDEWKQINKELKAFFKLKP
jgi:hypothetical protein